jgi:hypothetical protein
MSAPTENPAVEAVLSTMEIEIQDAMDFARERLDEDASPRPEFLQSPAVIEAIEAEFVLSLYNARRLARRRLLGLEPGPIATPEALDLLRRARAAHART